MSLPFALLAALAPTVAAGPGGFALQSAEGDYRLRFGGYLHFDGRAHPHDDDHARHDGFVIRRARTVFEGDVGRAFGFRLMTDFGEGRVQLLDAHLDVRPGAGLTLRAGKFKAPVGLERLLSATALPFVERALPTQIAPNRDVGLVLLGEHGEGAVTWALGVTDGAPDGGSVDASDADGVDVVARVFVEPLRATGVAALAGLGVGVAGTWGRDTPEDGFRPPPGVAAYRSAGGTRFFALRAGASPAEGPAADGDRWRATAQARYTWGRLGLLGEYIRASHDLRVADETATLVSQAWQAAVTLLLTDDAASFSGVQPADPVTSEGGGFGAWEVAARATGLSVGDDAFPLLADPATSARAATALAGGVNWYLDRAFKVQLDYERTTFDAAPGGTALPDEHLVAGRIQLRF